jgi:Protein of unknwon function (DUF3310)
MAENALQKQVGGSHYRDLPIQPIAYIFANGLGFAEGNVVKYVTRWRVKNGIEDLKKAQHYLELLIQQAQSEEDHRDRSASAEQAPSALVGVNLSPGS